MQRIDYVAVGYAACHIAVHGARYIEDLDHAADHVVAGFAIGRGRFAEP